MQQEIWFQKYHIIRLLGSGGTARVYLAKHIKLNSYRAIKCISKTHPLYDLQRNEAHILKNLKHSCIPIIYDIEEDEEGSYIVEQYLEGETLKDHVLSNGPIREDIIINYAIQLCDLFHYLHSNDRPVIYVDLKPENLMIVENSLKLFDFGSAIYPDEFHKINTTATRGYAAPELYRQGGLDDRCDIYGIGMLLYYMTTGVIITPKVKQISNIDQISGYSKDLKHIINHCLKFNPAHRYATVSQLKKQLSALLPKSGVRQALGQRQIIAVAGTQPRMGVTHMAFRVCNFMRSRGTYCMYTEKNKSGCIRRMLGSLEQVSENSGTFIVEGIPMQLSDQAVVKDESEATVIIIDYGILSKDNLDVFLQADTKLLVMGAKEWELAYSEEVLDMIAEYKDIIYLFNFLDGKQFQIVCRNMERQSCYRIPYEPNPFRKITAKNGHELFQELFGADDRHRPGISKLRQSRKGRNNSHEA